METLRESPWRDLDVLVAAEFDALEAYHPRTPRRPGREPGPEADEADDDGVDAFVDEFQPMEEADDEEAFIERTAAWLRERPDAEALMEAVRAALAEPAPGPGEVRQADPAADVAEDPQPGAAEGGGADDD